MFEVLCIHVDLVKLGVLALVGEIRNYRNDRHYHYYYASDHWLIMHYTSHDLSESDGSLGLVSAMA